MLSTGSDDSGGSDGSDGSGSGDPYPDKPLSFKVLEGMYDDSIVAPLGYGSNDNNDSNDGTTSSSSGGANEKRPVLLARFVSWILKKVVQAKTKFVEGLEISIGCASNRQILRGKVDTVELKFDKIAFGQIFVTGGGRLIIQGLDLRMRRFLFQNIQSLRKPYRIYGDFLLTQSDIVNSKFIRNLIQLLVNTILVRVLQASEILSVSIRKVTIRNRRLFAQGTVSSSVTSSNIINFEVATGAGVRADGRVIYLKDIQVVLNPDSVLRAAVPILLTTPIDVDLGEDCRIENFVIANKSVWLRAVSIISPDLRVTETPSIALYRFDLAALLSSTLFLKGGIVTLGRWLPSEGA